MTSNSRQTHWRNSLNRTWTEEEIIVDFPSIEERAGRVALNKNRKHSRSCDIIIVTPSDQRKQQSKTKPLDTMDCENFSDRWHQ